MPSDPVTWVLDRNLSLAAAKRDTDIAGPLLREIVNYATRVFARCDDSRPEIGPERVALMYLYLHIIEMIDGVDALSSAAAAGPATPVLRSAFEAVWALEYILKEDTTRRALSWLAKFYHTRMITNQRFDSSTEQGKQFQSSMQKSRIGGLDIPTDKARQAVAFWRGKLDAPELASYKAEIKHHRNGADWYTLFNGPKTLEQLTDRIQRGPEYQILYRQWAAEAHVENLLRFMQRTRPGDPFSRLLRNPSEVPAAALLGAQCLLRATRLILGKFRPDELGDDFARWYKVEVQERLHWISERVTVPSPDF